MLTFYSHYKVLYKSGITTIYYGEFYINSTLIYNIERLFYIFIFHMKKFIAL